MGDQEKDANTRAGTGQCNESTTSSGEQVLQHFWDLATPEKVVRSRAAVTLVNDLLKSQAEYAGAKRQLAEDDVGAEGATRENKVGAQLAHCSQLVVYSLKRLVRGLGSGRQAARPGYALALTLLLNQLDAVPTATVLDLIDITLQLSNSMKGGDARDALLGRGFGYSAVIRSGRTQHDPQIARQVARSLLQLFHAKAYLRELAAAALLELFASLGDAEFRELLAEVEELKDLIQLPAPLAPPEALYVALQLWHRLPQDILGECSLLPRDVDPPPPGFFTEPLPVAADHPTATAEAFFTAAHVEVLLECLKTTTAGHPHLHSVWGSLLALLLPGFSAVKVATPKSSIKNRPGSGQLEIFWNLVVEGGLYTSSNERRYLGFQLFQLLLPHLGPDQIPVVFSPNFRYFLANSLSRQDHALFAAARKAADCMVSFANNAADPPLRVALAVALQKQRGGGFDALTKTHTTANLLKNMDSASVDLYVKHLKDVFVSGEPSAAEQEDDPDEEEPDIEGPAKKLSALEASRHWVVEQLAGACGLPAISSRTQQAAARYLTLLAFFELDPDMVKEKELKAVAKIKPQPSAATRKLCAARLITLLEKAGQVHRDARDADQKARGDEVKRSSEAGEPSKGGGLRERRGENMVLKQTVDFLSSAQDLKGALLLVELDEPIAGAVNTLRKLEAKAAKSFAKVEGDRRTTGGAADQQLCFLHLARWLQLYIIGDAENVEPELAEELLSLYKSAHGKAGKKESEERGKWMDRLVDIALSLLAYSSVQMPSNPLREAVQAFFRAYATQLTPTGMQDLVRVVTKPEKTSKDEDAEVLAADDDFEDDEENEDEDDAGETLSGDLDAQESDKEDLEDRNGIRTADMMVDGEEASTSSDEGDEDMTDEQMFKMDKMLAAVLRTQKDAKGNAKHAQEAMLSFKLRTLNLLDAYARVSPASSLVPPVLVDLVREAVRAEGRGPTHKPLALRLVKVIGSLCKSKPSQEAARTVDPKLIGAAMIQVHLLASKQRLLASGGKAGSAISLPAVKTALYYLFGTAVAADTGEHWAAAEKGLKRMFSDFFRRRDSSKLLQTPIMEVIRRHPGMAEVVLPELVQEIGDARTLVLRMQAIMLFDEILRLPKDRLAAISDAVTPLLPAFSQKTVSILRGEGITNAAKHTEVLRLLAHLWEVLHRLLAEDFEAKLGPEDVALVRAECSRGHQMAPTLKVATHVGRIAKLVNVTPGAFKADGEKLTYATTGKTDASTKQKNEEVPISRSGSKRKQGLSQKVGKSSTVKSGQKVDALSAKTVKKKRTGVKL